MPGDAELERLYDAHAPALFAFLLGLMRDEADVRDVLQEVFIKIVRDGSLLRGVRNERAFFVRLAHNAAVDLMRRRGTLERAKVNLAEVLSPFAPVSDPDEEMFRNELASALAELPEEQRTVAHLKLWGGLTFEGIAEALEISPNTAASRYRYALDKLRGRLRPLYEEINEK